MVRTLIAVLAFIAGPAFAAPFAMITDLKGQAWAMDGAQPKKLALLGYIENPTDVKVDPNGKVAITYFANGVQYSFAGPARVSLESGAPKVIEGQAGEFKKVTPEKSIGGGLSRECLTLISRRPARGTWICSGLRARRGRQGRDSTQNSAPPIGNKQGTICLCNVEQTPPVEMIIVSILLQDPIARSSMVRTSGCRTHSSQKECEHGSTPRS